MKNGTTNEKTLGENANRVRNITATVYQMQTKFEASPKRVALFPSRANPGPTRIPGDQINQIEQRI